MQSDDKTDYGATVQLNSPANSKFFFFFTAYFLLYAEAVSWKYIGDLASYPGSSPCKKIVGRSLGTRLLGIICG